MEESNQMQNMHQLAWLRKLKESPEYAQNGHLVFVYGTLKRGFYNSPILEESELLTVTRTKDSKYEMVSIMNLFPAVIPGEFRISGEVYRISGMALWQLDMIEDHGDLYERRKVNVEGLKEPVWMYFLLDMNICPPSHMSPLVFTNSEEWTQTWISLDEEYLS